MDNVIKTFLYDKGRGKLDNEEHKFNKYSIQFVHNNVLINGYLQDVKQTIDKQQYSLELVILGSDNSTLYTVTKSCVAPEGCLVDWDSIHCSYNITV